MAMKKNVASRALQYTYDKFIGDDPEQNASYEQELVNIEVAKRLYELRVNAGLSQRELAKKVGTTASAICRLEDSDYEGHSLSILRRIAAALDKRVEIRFVAIPKRQEVRPGPARSRGKRIPRKEERARRHAPPRNGRRTMIPRAQRKARRRKAVPEG